MATFFIVLCGALAVLFVALAIGGGVQASRTRAWTAVPGRVRHSGIRIDLVQDEAERGDIDAYERRFLPWVSYEYEAGGAPHLGSLVALGATHASGSDRRALAVVERYREGAAITVLHDPREPAKSVLEPGASRAFVAGMIALVLLAGLFLAIAVMIARLPPSLD